MDFKYRKIVLFAIFCSSLSFSFDITKYHIGDMIDAITSNDEQYAINRLVKNEPIYYTPTDTIYDVNYTISSYNSKFGDIVLYDLSYDDKYLNAIDYNELYIQGEIEGCHLSISDKNLFHKEDNIPLIFDQNHTVFLEKIYNDIDLSRLKYIVLFKDKSTCNIGHIRFIKKQKPTTYLNNSHKATWVWNPSKDISITKLKDFNITKTYIQIKDGFETVSKNLKDTNITIYGLNGSPSDIYSYQHLQNDIIYLGNLKDKYPNIKGYQIDVEPYLLKNFQNDKDRIIKAYIQMLSSLSNLAHKNDLSFSVVIPFWFDNVFYKNTNLAKIVLQYADEVVLMSYRSDLNKVIDISKHILAMGDFSHKKVYIGIELMPIKDEFHTIYKIVSKNSCLSLNGFQKECLGLNKIKQYTIKGSSISFYNQYNKLKDIDKIQVPFKSFQGFVLHYYSVLP